jgi:hypothetical protein
MTDHLERHSLPVPERAFAGVLPFDVRDRSESPADHALTASGGGT